jgi:predicted metallopeptidase
MPWARGLVFKSRFINVMKCKVCSLFENKDKIIGCKWDTLTKHQRCRIVVHNMPKLGMKKGGEYIAHDCIHLRNMKLYA